MQNLNMSELMLDVLNALTETNNIVTSSKKCCAVYISDECAIADVVLCAMEYLLNNDMLGVGGEYFNKAARIMSDIRVEENTQYNGSKFVVFNQLKTTN